MRIACDLDGILVDWITGAKQTWPEKFTTNYQPKDWEFSDILSKDDWSELFRRTHAVYNFWLMLPEYPDNVTVLRDFLIKNPGIECTFLTSRNETLGTSPLVQTCQWLKIRELWPRNGSSNVVVVRRPELKRQVIEALDIKFSIDDKPETVNNCLDILGHQPYLFSRSWNRGNNWYGKVPVVFSMEEFLGHVKYGMVKAVGE